MENGDRAARWRHLAFSPASKVAAPAAGRRLGVGRFSPFARLYRRAVSFASVHQDCYEEDQASPAVRAAREVREFVRSYHRVWSNYALISEVLRQLRHAESLPRVVPPPTPQPPPRAPAEFDSESYINVLVERASPRSPAPPYILPIFPKPFQAPPPQQSAEASKAPLSERAGPKAGPIELPPRPEDPPTPPKRSSLTSPSPSFFRHISHPFFAVHPTLSAVPRLAALARSAHSDGDIVRGSHSSGSGEEESTTTKRAASDGVTILPGQQQHPPKTPLKPGQLDVRQFLPEPHRAFLSRVSGEAVPGPLLAFGPPFSAPQSGRGSTPAAADKPLPPLAKSLGAAAMPSALTETTVSDVIRRGARPNVASLSAFDILRLIWADTAAVVIQKHCRSLRAKRQVHFIRKKQNFIRKATPRATMIQTAFRGFLGRLAVAREVAVLQILHSRFTAARAIQAMFRAHKARHEFRTECLTMTVLRIRDVAARVIQRSLKAQYVRRITDEDFTSWVVQWVWGPKNAVVELIGDFSNPPWQKRHLMRFCPVRNAYTVALPRRPGMYEFKYCVNGVFLCDGSQVMVSEKRSDQATTYNNVAKVRAPHPVPPLLLIRRRLCNIAERERQFCVAQLERRHAQWRQQQEGEMSHTYHEAPPHPQPTQTPQAPEPQFSLSPLLSADERKSTTESYLGPTHSAEQTQVAAPQGPDTFDYGDRATIIVDPAVRVDPSIRSRSAASGTSDGSKARADVPRPPFREQARRSSSPDPIILLEERWSDVENETEQVGGTDTAGDGGGKAQGDPFAGDTPTQGTPVDPPLREAVASVRRGDSLHEERPSPDENKIPPFCSPLPSAASGSAVQPLSVEARDTLATAPPETLPADDFLGVAAGDGDVVEDASGTTTVDPSASSHGKKPEVVNDSEEAEVEKDATTKESDHAEEDDEQRRTPQTPPRARGPHGEHRKPRAGRTAAAGSRTDGGRRRGRRAR